MKHLIRISLFPILALALSTLLTVKAEEEPTNNPTCPADAIELASGGAAKRTCIDSTAYDGKRCFYTYVPDCAGENAPLVFDIHGYGSCPFFSFVYTGWKTKADENCFVLVWPTGNTDPEIADRQCFGFPGGLEDDGDGGIISPPCCCAKGISPVVTDDSTFLRQTAAVVVRDIPNQTSNRVNKVTIDTKRIYMAGHSNGCISAIAMATLNSDMVAAVGCHAGVAIAPFPDSYIPTPVFIVIGTADLTVNYNGNENFLSSASVHSLIASANGCTDSNENQVVNSSSPLNNYTEFTSSSCDNNATVVLVALENVGHSPYLGYEESTMQSVEEGTVVTTVDTTQMAWDFVKSHSLAVAPILVAPPVSDEEDAKDEDGVISADTTDQQDQDAEISDQQDQNTDAEPAPEDGVTSADTTGQQDKDAEISDSSGASSAWNFFAILLLFSVCIA